MDLVNISQQILLAVKYKEPADSFVNILENLSEENIRNDLTLDNLKKAFWINLYNAYTQLILLKDHRLYTSRSAFYGKRHLLIAGLKLSHDDIEHGNLRRSKIKWSEG